MADLRLTPHPTPGRRYWYDNGWFTYGDGATYALLLRAFEPKRVVEIGSGFSSALLLDVNDAFFDGAIECVFVEPFPERLWSVLDDGDESLCRVIEAPAQEVGIGLVADLDAGDILFIDSTHVVKTGSDVEWIFRELLPAVPIGTLVHFHDVFYPFEYPAEWVFEGRGWNEVYMLRSFLQFNDAFEIMLFSRYLVYEHHAVVANRWPQLLTDPGASIWLRRVK
ncbi:MAG TPA: class I SAM-dependent methyltransferase [Thermoanaerobaculia bacterium]|nr:class I SAM-dependent methyltransferase [Thermoanaerobaculia bacterium]